MTKKRELALELAEIMGWTEDGKKMRQLNNDFQIDTLKQILDKIVSLQIQRSQDASR